MLIGWLIALALSSLVTLASFSAFENCLELYVTQQSVSVEQHEASWLYQHLHYQLRHLAAPIYAEHFSLLLQCYDESRKLHRLKYQFKDHTLLLKRDLEQPLILYNNILAWQCLFAEERNGQLLLLQVDAVRDWDKVRFLKFMIEFSGPQRTGVGAVFNNQRWSWIIAPARGLY